MFPAPANLHINISRNSSAISLDSRFVHPSGWIYKKQGVGMRVEVCVAFSFRGSRVGVGWKYYNFASIVWQNSRNISRKITKKNWKKWQLTINWNWSQLVIGTVLAIHRVDRAVGVGRNFNKARRWNLMIKFACTGDENIWEKKGNIAGYARYLVSFARFASFSARASSKYLLRERDERLTTCETRRVFYKIKK